MNNHIVNLDYLLVLLCVSLNEFLSEAITHWILLVKDEAIVLLCLFVWLFVNYVYLIDLSLGDLLTMFLSVLTVLWDEKVENIDALDNDDLRSLALCLCFGDVLITSSLSISYL
jgi:hypothetical protein